MGLFDKLIDAAIDEVVMKPIYKAQANKMRRDLQGSIFSDEEIEEMIEDVYGDDAVKKRNAEYSAEQKRQKEQYHQYLIDHHACAVCRYRIGHECFYYFRDNPGFTPRQYDPSYSGYTIDIEDPERCTCGNYKRDWSK